MREKKINKINLLVIITPLRFLFSFFLDQKQWIILIILAKKKRKKEIATIQSN